MQTLRRLAGPLAIVVLISACAGGAASSGSVSPASSSPPVTAAPSTSGDAPASNDPGTSASPSAGLGDTPLVIPKPGQLDVKAVKMDKLDWNEIDGRIIIIATWTSGVEPCYVLDHIVVAPSIGAYEITLFEGHGPGDNVCIEIAQTKNTEIDLGPLGNGVYQISDGAGGAAPIQVIGG